MPGNKMMTVFNTETFENRGCGKAGDRGGSLLTCDPWNALSSQRSLLNIGL